MKHQPGNALESGRQDEVGAGKYILMDVKFQTERYYSRGSRWGYASIYVPFVSVRSFMRGASVLLLCHHHNGLYEVLFVEISRSGCTY